MAYYVRADGTAANKAAATSDASASTSMSITTHNGETFSPGDTIVVSDIGGVYRGTTLNTPSSGTTGLPIRYEASGTPDMRGSQLVTGWTTYSGNTWQAAVTTEPKQVFVDGTFGDRKTSIVGCVNNYDWYWASNVLYLYSSTGDPDNYVSPGIEAGYLYTVFEIDRDYIQVDGLTFRHGNWSNLHGTSTSHTLITNCVSEWGWVTGYRTDNAVEATPFQDVIFEDCIGRYCGGHGFLINTNHNNCVVRRCDAYENGRYQGIWEAVEHEYTSGIKAWGNRLYITGYTVEYCRCWSNGPSPEVDDCDLGVGIWIDQSLGTSEARNKIRYNLVWDSNAYGIFIECSSYDDVYYNLVWDSAKANWEGSIAIKCWGDQNASYNRIYNNVVYNSYGYSYQCETYVSGDSPHTDYNEFYNNISRNSQWWLYGKDLFAAGGGGNNGTNGVGNKYYNNCFSPEASTFIRWNATSYSTISAWETAASGAAVSNISGDPTFQDQANHKFWLQAGSPCLGNGANLGSPYNRALRPSSAWPSNVRTVDQGTLWDMGAYGPEPEGDDTRHSRWFHLLTRRRHG